MTDSSDDITAHKANTPADVAAADNVRAALGMRPQARSSAGSAREPSLNCPACGALLWDYPDGRQTCSRCEWEEKCITGVAQAVPVAKASAQLIEALKDIEISAYNAAKFRIGKAIDLLSSQPSLAATVDNQSLAQAIYAEGYADAKAEQTPAAEPPRDPGLCDRVKCGCSCREALEKEVERLTRARSAPAATVETEEWAEVTDGTTKEGDRFSYIGNSETGVGQITSHRRRVQRSSAGNGDDA